MWNILYRKHANLPHYSPKSTIFTQQNASVIKDLLHVALTCRVKYVERLRRLYNTANVCQHTDPLSNEPVRTHNPSRNQWGHCWCFLPECLGTHSKSWPLLLCRRRLWAPATYCTAHTLSYLRKRKKNLIQAPGVSQNSSTAYCWFNVPDI